jgi:S-DNA-T family DNA segregation ATPase FtsK/SpoIIIE
MASQVKNIDYKKKKNSSEGNFFQRHRIGIAIFIFLVGFLLILSMVSYTPKDEANLISFSEIGKILTGDELVRQKLERTHNWLGFIGAKISFFLLNYAFGYSSILLGLILMIWGVAMFFNKVSELVVRWSFYILVALFLISVFLGNLKLMFGTEEFRVEICGTVGLYVADILIKLFGELGSFLIVLTSFLILVGFIVELNFYDSVVIWGDKIVSLLRKLKPKMAKRKQSKIQVLKPSQAELPKQTEVKISQVEPKQDKIDEIAQEPIVEVSPDVKKTTVSKDAVRNQQVRKKIDFKLPPIELLDPSEDTLLADEEELNMNAELLRNKLANFDIDIEKITITPGPVVTLYEIVPAADVKIREIVSLADDIALALAARGIRVIAPMPGKGTVGIEIPNRKPSIVRIRSVIDSREFKNFNGVLPIAMGKTITGEVYCDDLAKMPHLLIGGATGSGKSVGINTIIVSLLYKLLPSEVKFVIIDPKKVELVNYRKLVNHYLAVCPDVDEEIITTPENAVLVLKSLVIEMNERYDKFSKAGVRNIQDYNERIRQGRIKSTEEVQHFELPYIVVIIDELADLMLVASNDVEEPITRLAQLARGVGIHLVIATQRPSVDVITGLIKANFPTRIAYQVASKVDSRTILDMNGAEQLIGSGDMLYLPAGASKPIRIQNAFVSVEEVERIVDYIASQPGYDRPYELPSVVEKQKIEINTSDDFDELFDEAAKIVVRYKQASTSLLQRKLKIGYARAARIMDQLEREGIVGPPIEGNKARDVLIESEIELEEYLKTIKNK